jgi:16S rRNA (guanine527-N7)-methyltransferase
MNRQPCEEKESCGITPIPNIIGQMESFVQSCKKLGVSVSDAQLSKFIRYRSMLLQWNERFNLTAIKSEQGVDIRHFLDSLSLASLLGDMRGMHLVDVGSGAGFPGLPLKIIQPDLQLTLVESVQKKAGFMNQVIEELELTQCRVLSLRAEDLGRSTSGRERYDAAVARAVANLSVLVEYLLPLTRIGGFILAPKGKEAHRETQKAETAIQILGGRLQGIMQVEIPGLAEERYVVVIDKVAATPEKYPRRAGMAVKRPL